MDLMKTMQKKYKITWWKLSGEFGRTWKYVHINFRILPNSPQRLDQAISERIFYIS